MPANVINTLLSHRSDPRSAFTYFKWAEKMRGFVKAIDVFCVLLHVFEAKEQVANKVNGVRVLGNQLLVEFEYEVEHQYFNTSSETLHSTLLYKTQENNGKATFRCDISRLKDSTFIHKAVSAKLSSLQIHSQFHGEIAKEIIKYARKSIHRSFYDNDRSFFTLFAKVTRTHNMYRCERCLELQAMENSMVELQRRNCGMVPATKSSVEKLLKRVRVVAAEEEDEEEEKYSRKRKMRRCVGENKTCTICLEEFGAGDGDRDGDMSRASCMPCLHVFHEDCIRTWLDNSHYCPVCRFEIPIVSSSLIHPINVSIPTMHDQIKCC